MKQQLAIPRLALNGCVGWIPETPEKCAGA